MLLLDSGESPAKKKSRYELSKEMKQWISEDEANKKIWDELFQAANNNSVCVCVCTRAIMCVYNYACICVCKHVCVHACLLKCTHEINEQLFYIFYLDNIPSSSRGHV